MPISSDRRQLFFRLGLAQQNAGLIVDGRCLSDDRLHSQTLVELEDSTQKRRGAEGCNYLSINHHPQLRPSEM